MDRNKIWTHTAERFWGAGRGGAGRGDKRHSQATFPKSTEFEDSWPFLSFFLSFFLTPSGSGKSPDPKIHEHFSCLCRSLSLSRTRTHAHASSSRASFSRLLRQSFKGFRTIASSAEAGHNSRQLSRLIFLEKNSALIPNFLPFFFPSSFSFLFFLFFFGFFLFFGRV